MTIDSGVRGGGSNGKAPCQWLHSRQFDCRRVHCRCDRSWNRCWRERSGRSNAAHGDAAVRGEVVKGESVRGKNGVRLRAAVSLSSQNIWAQKTGVQDRWLQEQLSSLYLYRLYEPLPQQLRRHVNELRCALSREALPLSTK